MVLLSLNVKSDTRTKFDYQTNNSKLFRAMLQLILIDGNIITFKINELGNHINELQY